MTPQERVQLRRFEQWLSDNQTELDEYYAKALHQPISELGLYPMPDGVHAHLALGNGMTLDFLLPGIDTDPVLNEFTYGETP